MSVIAEPARLAALWERIRAMLARACFAIGAFDPRAALTPERRLSIARWIELIETIVRKVLLVEATALIVTERAARGANNGPRLTIVPLRGLAQPFALVAVPPRGGGTVAGARPFDATKPETWRVRFNLKPPRDPHACTQRPRIRALCGGNVVPHQPPPRAQGDRTPSALHLAMRIEAVRRVLANPAPHVKRLACLLPKLCVRDPQAPMRYATEPARPHRGDEADPRLMVETTALALDVAPLVPDSS